MKMMGKFYRPARQVLLMGAAALLPLMALADQGKQERSAATLIEGRCAMCHGARGNSASVIYPRLAAQHPQYLRKQLADFRDGRRQSDTMSAMAQDLSDAEIAALADFFAAQPAGARRAGNEDLVAMGRYLYQQGNHYSSIPACATCHGPQAHGTESLPRLAGQHPAYLEVQLKEFNRHGRTNDSAIMQSIAAKLTELEIHALATYIGSLQ